MLIILKPIQLNNNYNNIKVLNFKLFLAIYYAIAISCFIQAILINLFILLSIINPNASSFNINIFKISNLGINILKINIFNTNNINNIPP